MTNNENIRAALIGAINALSLPYPIKWPNKPTIKNGAPYTPNGEPWLRVTPMYGDKLNVTLSEYDKLNGILQIDIFLPKDSGDLVGTRVVDTITTALPINGDFLQSGNVKVQFETHKIGRHYEEGAWYVMIMESKFYSFLDRE